MQANESGSEPVQVSVGSSDVVGPPQTSTEAISAAIPPVSSLPSQFTATSLLAPSPLATTNLLSKPPQPLTTTMQAEGFTSPLLISGMSPTPLPSAGLSTSMVPSVGPPPKTGFQPTPHTQQESHLPTSPLQNQAAPTSSAQAGVNIFTPKYDTNATPSPYSSPAATLTPAYTPPPAGGVQPAGSSSIVQLDMPTGGQTPSSQPQYQIQSPQDLSSLLEWLKTNETVTKMMQKAKVGVETVITAMDPQMKDVLYSGGDISIVVASSKPVKVEPVKEAFQRAFGRATVFGKDSQPSIAPQPVGFSSGVKGSEERIANLRRSGLVSDKQVCVAIESFIVDLQSEQWYDISCLMLSDPVNNITLHTFSQATPISAEYVQQAQSETPADYSLAWSGLSVTVGNVMYRHNTMIDPSNWHSFYAGVSRSDTLLLAAKQLAFMYKQRLARNV